MTITIRPNRDALRRAIDIYRDAMRPFIIRCLKRVPGTTVEGAIARSLPPHQANQFDQDLLRNRNNLESAIDVNLFPPLIQRSWRETFSTEFREDKTIQSELWMISKARNQVSHPGTQDLESEYTRTHLFLIADALGRINAREQKQAVEEIRDQLTAPSTVEENAGAASQLGHEDGDLGREQPANLKPWREVIRPNQDVAQGSYQQAEFAADLQQVHDGRAAPEHYGNPVDFFNHTYITPGIRTLLVNAMKRITGKGGDPVIQTKTGFGGGKTHSLIALYHLVKHIDALTNPSDDKESKRTSEEISKILEEAGVNSDTDIEARVAVLDGTYLSTTDTTKTREKGDRLNTLWGQMAYQLGGQDGYDIVGEAARQGTAPGGNQLDQLFAHVGPCVILIDELVAYVRNAAGSQDNIYTFIQALTQSARRRNNVAVVVTLPERAVEAGAERGQEALDRLASLMERIETVWEPLEIHETFEVVRRRLFHNVTDSDERDRTCDAFSRMYSRSRSDYPQGVAEHNYLERMKACYPIHPEIFDRLYQDWSSNPNFQRTRGVLRMMATCISRLYQINDPSPLILPANLPLNDPSLASEFTGLLSGQWDPVISEVDSVNSKTDLIDKGRQRFGDVGGAAQRTTRTIFLGSAQSGAVRGIDARQVHLGVVQPGHGVAVYKEALSETIGALYYLYHSNGRYYFHAEANLNKVAVDRQGELTMNDLDLHILGLLDGDVRNRRSDVVVYTDHSTDVPDSDTVRLVVLPPGQSLPSRSQEIDDASPEALKILRQRGDVARVRRNTLLFLASKKDETRNLRNAVRTYLAWNSIVNGERRITSLSGDRYSQARNSLNAAERDVRAALVRAYRWAMAPVQEDPQKSEYRMRPSQTGAADAGEIVRSAFEKFLEDEALVDEISPAALASMLQRYVWSSEGYRDHIHTDALWDMMTSNVYMHRLRNRSVLLNCISRGVPEGAFGCADGYHSGDYTNLRFREGIPHSPFGVTEVKRYLLVNSVMAELVKDEMPDDEAQPQDTSDGEGTADPLSVTATPDPAVIGTLQVKGPQSIIASKKFEGDISLDHVGEIRAEIIRNLREAGGKVTVQITISALKEAGFSENVTRSVRENSAQLGFDFESPQ